MWVRTRTAARLSEGHRAGIIRQKIAYPLRDAAFLARGDPRPRRGRPGGWPDPPRAGAAPGGFAPGRRHPGAHSHAALSPRDSDHGPDPGSKGEETPLPTYTESAGSEYVLLPVLVFDQKGRFVDGLEKKDFRVQAGGVKVDLDTFDKDDERAGVLRLPRRHVRAA